MGDHTSITLRIGGALPQDKLAALEDFLAIEGFANGDGQIETELLAAIDGKRAADFGDDEAYASIEDSFKAFCREHGLTYRMSWDRMAYYDGGIFMWQPGWAKEKTVDTIEGVPVFNVGELAHRANRDMTVSEVIDELLAFDGSKVPALQITDAVPALAEMVA